MTTNIDPKASAEAVASIDAMVDRFLGWKLPKTFAPDAGISFKPPSPDAPAHFWPIGTNLFTADEARQMFAYVLGGKEET